MMLQRLLELIYSTNLHISNNIDIFAAANKRIFNLKLVKRWY